MAQFSFTPLAPEHLRFFTPHPVQTDEYNAMLTMAGYDCLSQSVGLTGWLGTRCVGCAGVMPIWPGRAEAWVIAANNVPVFAALAGMHMARSFLKSYPVRRLETAVKVDNVAGQRLAVAVGLTLESDKPLRKYHPDGSDMYMYARIREDM